MRAAVGSDARILAERERLSGAHLRFGLPSPGGYDPLAPRRVQHLLGEIGVRLGAVKEWPRVARAADVASLLGLGIVVAPPAHVGALAEAGFEARDRLPDGDVLTYRPPVPRARIVHRTVVVADEKEALAWTVRNASRARATVVLEEEPPMAPVEPPGGATEATSITADAPTLVALRATLASPGLLVLADTWYPGWTVRVDGRSARLLRADHAFRAVTLPAGEHRVEFRYVPTWLVPGTMLGVLGAGCLLACVLVGREPKRAEAA
jgi:hypothetical protein